MGNVFRIACVKMLVLLRLAMVASLTLYTLPSASYAMHGDSSATYDGLSADGHAEHASAVLDADADQHDHGVPHGVSENDQKPVKQDCCSDFCISLAIIGNAPGFWRALQRPIRDFHDDGSVFVQLPSLHRPPITRS